jgi:hypothetical protein
MIFMQAQAPKMPHLEDGEGKRLVCFDGRGNRHEFRWRYWINNSSRMYLLESLQNFYVQLLNP